jgi:hypothetical protein
MPSPLIRRGEVGATTLDMTASSSRPSRIPGGAEERLLGAEPAVDAGPGIIPAAPAGGSFRRFHSSGGRTSSWTSRQRSPASAHRVTALRMEVELCSGVEHRWLRQSTIW